MQERIEWISEVGAAQMWPSERMTDRRTYLTRRNEMTSVAVPHFTPFHVGRSCSRPQRAASAVWRKAASAGAGLFASRGVQHHANDLGNNAAGSIQLSGNPTVQSFSRRVLRQAALTAISSLAVTPVGAVAQKAGASTASPICTIREVSREPLVLGGRIRVYVEADAFVADAQGNTLLAGMPNSLTRMNTAGAVTAVVDDSILGVIIPRAGSPRLVELPRISAGRKLDGIRVAARPRGGWTVAFAEVEARHGSENADSTVRLWYGVYDGARWRGLEELPMPRSGVVDARWASSLVSHGDTVSWAMTHRTESGPQIVLFERHRGRWSHELIPTFHSEVELGRSDALGLFMFVVQPHTSPGERDANSLVLWSRRPAWEGVRRLVHGSVEGRVYNPKFAPSPTGGVLTWESAPISQRPRGRELRAMLGRWADGTARPVTLDSAVSSIGGYSNTVAPRPDFRLWVSVPVAADRSRPKLRFLTDFERSSVTIGETANPYQGYIAAAAPTPTQLLVTGLQYIPNRYLVSLLLRTRIDCRNGPNSRR